MSITHKTPFKHPEVTLTTLGKYNSPETVTDDELAQMKVAYKEAENHNNAIRKLRLERLKEIRTQIEDLYGSRHKFSKYAQNMSASDGRNDPYINFSDIERRVKDARYKAEQKVREAETKAKESELLEKAVAYLMARGLTIGTDFKLESAISQANDIAYEEAVERRTAELGGGYISFGGDDYCEDCSGWNGQSRRCQCGNRRVDWESWGGNFVDGFTLAAVAY